MKDNYDMLYSGCTIYVVTGRHYDIEEFIIDEIYVTQYTNYITDEPEKKFSIKYHNETKQFSCWKIHGTFFTSLDEAKQYVIEECSKEIQKIENRAEELRSLINKNKS